ncbi:hypothetical protein EMIT07CA2_30310 [Brevibacillus sp. IT-7CA2]
MEDINPKYVTRSAIEGLVKKINLPAPNEFSHFNLDIEEKFAFMIVIINLPECKLGTLQLPNPATSSIRVGAGFNGITYFFNFYGSSFANISNVAIRMSFFFV